MDDAQPAEKSGGEALSSLNFSERAALHGDLRVIASAAQMALVHIDLMNATVGELLTTYDKRWDRDIAFTSAVVDYAGRLLSKGALGTLKTDLGERPRKLLDLEPPYLTLTVAEWLGALSGLGDDPEWP